jgi:hypothetical protein
MGLITPDDVIKVAFVREVDVKKVKAELIDAVQERHILPVLGETFYDLIVATPTSYTAVVDLINPVLAYFVKYYMLPDIYAEISTTGLNILSGQNRQQAPRETLADMKNAALDLAAMHNRRLAKYLDDNSSSYTDYYKTANPVETIVIAGGIIFDKGYTDDDDTDDYTINLKYY